MKNLLSITLVLVSFFGFSNNFPHSENLILTKLNGKEIMCSSVYITIDEATKTISGKSGCNTFNLSFEKKGSSCIRTASGMSTMMACDQAQMKLEDEFMKTIQERKFRVKTKDNKVFFKNWWGKTIMEFQIQTPESILKYISDNHWKLIMLNGVGQDYGDAHIIFDIKEHRVTGNTGCNSFFGDFKLEPDFISFNQIGVTKRACDAETNKIENAFLRAISDKKLRFDVADQTLNLYDGDRTVMIFGIVK